MVKDDGAVALVRPDTDPSSADGVDHDFIRSFARGLSVIRAFGADHPQLRLSDVAGLTGLSRGTARRLLHTLQRLGYAEATDGYFRLTPRVLTLGYAYLSSATLSEVAQPHLERLSAAVGESSSVCVLDEDSIVYVARVQTRQIMSVSIPLGTRLPAHATSMGQVLLADLSEDQLADYLARFPLTALTDRTLTDEGALRERLVTVREQGYASCYEELEAGLRSVAVPIRDRRDVVVAAMNISMRATSREATDPPQDLVAALRTSADAVSADLAALN